MQAIKRKTGSDDTTSLPFLISRAREREPGGLLRGRRGGKLGWDGHQSRIGLDPDSTGDSGSSSILPAAGSCQKTLLVGVIGTSQGADRLHARVGEGGKAAAERDHHQRSSAEEQDSGTLHEELPKRNTGQFAGTFFIHDSRKKYNHPPAER